MIEGSSTDPAIVAQVGDIARAHECVMLVLDSMHTHAHVLAELEAYAPMVTTGSYLVVLDTCVEFMPADAFPDRPWSRGNSPHTALRAFLAKTDRFEIDPSIHDKLQVTVARDGFLRCIRP